MRKQVLFTIFALTCKNSSIYAFVIMHSREISLLGRILCSTIQLIVVEKFEIQLPVGGNKNNFCYNDYNEDVHNSKYYYVRYTMNTIGQNIAYFRKQKKMTQEELAEKMAVTAQAVSKWECDTSYPDITAIQTLSKVLGVTPTELINGMEYSAEIKDAPQEIIDRRIVCIEVQVDETKIVTRFPVPGVKKAMENGTLKSLVGEDTYSQVVSILEMIDAGITGRLVDVKSPEAHTTITVEDYEN